ncbi:MAG: metallophosphoesterase, partial [Oscillospiraceae bacterium]
MKKILTLFLSLTFILVLSGCTAQKNIEIIQATDIHYLSQQLTDNSPAFVEMMSEADGKLTHYIEPITEAFISQVMEEKPDFLILSGDLTFNGEKLSHLDFAKKIKKVNDSGVTVLVIPGNHDIDYPFSMGFEGDSAYPTERISKEEYEQIYQEFGLSKATSRDKETFSYFYSLSKKVQVLMLDVNTGAQFGTVSEGTLNWIKSNLEAAKKEGIATVAVTHQNLLNQSQTLTKGFTIDNGEDLAKLLKEYNVKLNLSGHTHVQHIADSDGKLFDISTCALSVYPCQYGVVNINTKDMAIDYKIKKTEVSRWAQKNNITDENLKNFEEYSLEFFTQLSYNKAYNQLEETTIPTAEKEKMAMLFAQMNDYYFPGNLYDVVGELKESEGYRLWQKN